MQKYVPSLRIDLSERRDGGEGEERGLRKGERERIEIERKETKGN